MKLSILIPTIKPEVNKQIDEIRSTIFYKDAEIIASCQPVSASRNRNYCMDKASGDTWIQLDDDIEGFYPNWDRDLIQPLFDFPSIGLVSARLLKRDGSYNHTMGCPGIYEGVVMSNRDEGLCTACFSMRAEDVHDLRFDENFIKSGFEDDDFTEQFRLRHPKKMTMITNMCKLVHLNNMVGQSEGWSHNKSYFLQKYPHKKDRWHS